jgi:putative cardiolipin synthase
MQPKVAAHPGQSGMHPLADPRDAIAARLALADAAERSLDVQYFIWNKDLTGKALLEHLYRAADRGVRVRLLLDDLGTMPSDKVLLTIDSHPNIEVRMFNPASLRSPRLLGIVINLGRLNKRMHNKSFIADGQVAIVGGRNIGDEYFGADMVSNFADDDVVLIGPVVKETSAEFDLYWNHAAAIPIAKLAHQNNTPEQYAAQRAALATHLETAKQSEYADAVRHSEFSQQLRRSAVTFHWGHASIINDQPDKVLTASHKEETHLAPVLREMAMNTKHELYLVSPYFVPGKRGTELLSEVSRCGVRVVVITNSLASTDGVPVHSHYKGYRKPLIEAGIELYELKPTLGAGKKRRVGLSSGASLHAKTFAFDRRIRFIGSYNLDPRSSRLNTEMGVVMSSPELARRLPESVDPDLGDKAYRVQLEGRRLVWVTYKDGQEVRYHNEPEAGFWKRTKATVIGWLPIEGML